MPSYKSTFRAISARSQSIRPPRYHRVEMERNAICLLVHQIPLLLQLQQRRQHLRLQQRCKEPQVSQQHHHLYLTHGDPFQCSLLRKTLGAVSRRGFHSSRNGQCRRASKILAHLVVQGLIALKFWRRLDSRKQILVRGYSQKRPPLATRIKTKALKADREQHPRQAAVLDR